MYETVRGALTSGSTGGSIRRAPQAEERKDYAPVGLTARPRRRLARPPMMEVTRATRAITASRGIEISAGIISTQRAHEATFRQKQHHPDQRLHGSPFEPAAACRSAHSRSG